MIINCRYNPFILRRCDSLLFFFFFFLQWHRESTTICLLINWRCLRCSSFAIYYAVFALCQNAAQTHCIISGRGRGRNRSGVRVCLVALHQLDVRLPADNDAYNYNHNMCLLKGSQKYNISHSGAALFGNSSSLEGL